MTNIVAQAEITDLFGPVLMILVVVSVLIGAVWLVRKYMFSADDDAGGPMGGFSLGELRQLVKQGKMTQEEFDAAKAHIVAATQRETARQKPVIPPDTETKMEEPR
ncbi:MAG TPA: SHOCT domain-containing protein [Tepidisphaeraceae bacterium]|jgi:hypothetical protein